MYLLLLLLLPNSDLSPTCVCISRNLGNPEESLESRSQEGGLTLGETLGAPLLEGGGAQHLIPWLDIYSLRLVLPHAHLSR